MDVYLAGPVLPDPTIDALTAQAFAAISQAAERAGHELALPIRDAQLNALQPEEFVQEIDRRLNSSDAIVSLVRAGDQSVAVEATLASARGKPQLLVALDGDLPRLMAGLPSVRAVVDGRSPDLNARVGDFLERV